MSGRPQRSTNEVPALRCVERQVGRTGVIALCQLVVFAAVLGSVFRASEARALPWDIDMYRQESLNSSEVARAPAPGTVAIGQRPFTMTPDEADKALTNPVAFTQDSVWRGRRLWSAQCQICHGPNADGNPLMRQYLPVPNLHDEFYRGRSDGRIYGVIMKGGAAMPRYGFKLSETERWDIINYLRFLQGREMVGIPRPNQTATK